ncbi:hypothetical protein IIB34_03570 [PVC group bacterium]|nr:hypothetical protein [PVC group bacterium]
MERRKNVVTFKKFQMKYMALTVFIATLIAIFSAGAVYITVSLFISEFDYRGPGQTLVMREVMALGHHINLTILIGYLVVFPLITVFCLYMSHRITGPLFRLKDVLINIENGQYDEKFVIRGADVLGELADEINAVLLHLKNQKSMQKQMIEKIDNQIHLLQSAISYLSDNPSQSGQKVSELNQIVQAMQEPLDYLKKK